MSRPDLLQPAFDIAGLSSEQTKLIQERFEIHLYLGTHGHDLDTENRLLNPLRVSTQSEYIAAGRVARRLKPGGALFVEGLGFTESSPTLEPYTHQRVLEQFGLTSAGYLSLGNMVRENRASPDRQFELIEGLRQKHACNAWKYAAFLAQLNGVPTQYADLNAERWNRWRETNKYIPFAEFTMLPPIRERQAGNILINWALQNSNHEMAASEPRRELALLFGQKHKKGLERVFKAAGLSVSFTILQSDSAEIPWRTALNERQLLELERRKQQIASWLGSLTGSGHHHA